MTTQEYRVVTVSGEVHRVTVRAVDVNGVERWTVVGAPRRSRSADAWSSPTAAVMCEAQDRGLLVREIVPPGEMTRDEAVAAARGGSDEVAATGRVVAATRRCPACGGRGVRRYDDGTVDGCDGCGLLGRVPAEAEALREALRFLCRADTDACDFCGATATKRGPDGSWWCDVCAPPEAADHEHAATLRPLLPTRGGVREIVPPGEMTRDEAVAAAQTRAMEVAK